ncbi:MAG: hypothetical protein WDO19_11080 [Bacteroidota bacterium]
MIRTNKKIQVAVADDHKLLRNALARLVNTFEGYSVLFEADNGKDLRGPHNKTHGTRYRAAGCKHARGRWF